MRGGRPLLYCVACNMRLALIAFFDLRSSEQERNSKMTLTTLAKISAAYLGLAVTFATAWALWETGHDLANQHGLLRGFEIAETSTSG